MKLLGQPNEAALPPCAPMPTVLVIEDDAASRMVLTRILKRAGYQTMEAADGRRGLAVIANHGPDLVVTDLFMPELDGIEVIRAVRRSFPDTTVLTISGNAQIGKVDYLELALKLGADAVLQKPIRQGQLLDTVSHLLGCAPAAADPPS